MWTNRLTAPVILSARYDTNQIKKPVATYAINTLGKLRQIPQIMHTTCTPLVFTHGNIFNQKAVSWFITKNILVEDKELILIKTNTKRREHHRCYRASESAIPWSP